MYFKNTSIRRNQTGLNTKIYKFFFSQKFSIRRTASMQENLSSDTWFSIFCLVICLSASIITGIPVLSWWCMVHRPFMRTAKALFRLHACADQSQNSKGRFFSSCGPYHLETFDNVMLYLGEIAHKMTAMSINFCQNIEKEWLYIKV